MLEVRSFSAPSDLYKLEAISFRLPQVVQVLVLTLGVM